MKRKVIQLAGKTLVVSIPSKWAGKYRVKKGDEVEVEEMENRLVISSDKELNSDLTSIDISGTSPMIKRILGALYKTGYDEAEIKFTSTEELETALQVIKDEFIGFEVVKRGKNSLHVKNVATIQYAEFDNVLRRIFLVTLSMAEEGEEAIRANDMRQLKSIIFMDLDVNKYADFCRRILNKKGYSQFRKTPPLYYIVEEMEKTADAVRDMCACALEIKPSSNALLLFHDVAEFIRAFYEIYYSFELKKIPDFGKKRAILKEKILEAIKKSKANDSVLLLHAYIAVESCFNMNGALMAMNF